MRWRMTERAIEKKFHRRKSGQEVDFQAASFKCLKKYLSPQYVIDGIRFLELLDAVWFRYTTYKRETGKI